jgi:hypothetical protein
VQWGVCLPHVATNWHGSGQIVVEFLQPSREPKAIRAIVEKLKAVNHTDPPQFFKKASCKCGDSASQPITFW